VNDSTLSLRSLRLTFAAVVFAGLLAGCSGGAAPSDSGVDTVNNAAPVQQAAPAEQGTSTAGVLPTDESGAPIVALVNGEGITLLNFQRELARRQQEASFSNPDALEESVLTTMIEQQVIEQAAAAQQIIVTDAELEAETQSNIALAGSEDRWQTWLTTNLFTPEEFQNSLRSSLVTGRLRDSVTQNLADTVEQVHARHILVATEVEANAVMSRLQGGEDFGALASSLSNDISTRDQGGDLGWFSEGELLEPVLAQVAFSLEPGAVAGPIGTRLGYHVLQLLEKAERPVTPEMQANLAQLQFENWLQAQLSSATIERYLQ